MMGLRQVAIGSMAVVLAAAMLSPAYGQTAAERRERQRQERQQELAQRRAQREARQRETQQRDDARGGSGPSNAAPRSFEQPEDGFSLRTPGGWIAHGEPAGQVRLQLAYINLPPGQRDAGSFRLLMISPSPAQPLEQVARAWQQRIPFEGEAKHEPIERTQVGGLEALVVQSEGQREGMRHAERGVFVQRGNRTYILYTSSPANIQDRVMASARQIERSVKWLGEVVPLPPESERADAVKPAGKLLDRSTQGFTVHTPAGWVEFEAQTQGQMYLQVAYRDLPPGVRLNPTFRAYIYDPTRPESLETAANRWQRQFDSTPGAVIEPGDPTPIDGLEGLVRHVHSTYNGVEMFQRAVFVQRGRRTYLLETTTPKTMADVLLASAAEIERSFRWVGEPKPWPEAMVVRRPEPATPDPATPEPGADTASAPAEAGAEKPAEAPVRVPASLAAQVEAASRDLTAVDNNESGVRFKHPSAWNEVAPDGGAATVFLQLAIPRSGSADQPLVTFGTMDKGPLSQEPQSLVRLMGRMSVQAAKAVEGAEGPVGNKPGYAAVYAGRTHRSYIAAVEHRSQMYMIAFIAPPVTFEAWLPAVKAMVDSIEWFD